MREIFTSVDIGTDEIKVITVEYHNEKYNVLASSKVRSRGVKQGLIIDPSSCAQALKKAIKSVESKLGTKIDKVIAVVPSNNLKIDISSASIDITGELITGDDIFSLMQHSLSGRVDSSMEVVSVMPIEYKIGDKIYQNPLGLEADNLSMKCVIASVPKKNVYSVISVVQSLDIEVIDIIISSLADYSVVKAKELDSKVVAIINIGLEKTNLAIFNKGILIKESILPIGSIDIDDNISFSYKTSKEESRIIKEDFAVANRKYADSDEIYKIDNRLGRELVINQYRLAELIENKCVEMLKKIKNEINNLTNKEIGYIIITGGISSMLGFNAIVEQLFMRNSTVMDIGVIGIRDNKFSCSYGSIKNFVERLELREKEYSMFGEEKIEEMLKAGKKYSSSNVLGKIFGKIFD